MKKSDLYICSKPLQYFNLSNIPLNSETSNKILIIVGHFSNSREFADGVRQLDHNWDKVLYCRNDFFALIYVLFLKINNLYINYDISIILSILYHIKRMNIYTYEEGIGSYSSIQRWHQGSFISWIRNNLGVGQINNSSKFIKGVFLYNPDIFYSLRTDSTFNVFKLSHDFCYSLSEKGGIFETIYERVIKKFRNIIDSNVLIYITSWSINEKIMSDIETNKDRFDHVFIKLHPNIVTNSLFFPEYCDVISCPILVEYLLNILINNNNIVTVYHESSTSMVYFEGKVASYDYMGLQIYKDYIDRINLL